MRRQVPLIAAGSVDSRQVLPRVIVPFGSLYYAYVFTQKQTKEISEAHPERVGRGTLTPGDGLS
jgi:hypothetical protein